MEILIGIVFTWLTGLATPLIIRFIIIKKPLTKKNAIIVTVVNFILTFMIFIALGSQSKTHFTLYIMAIISYAILQNSNNYNKKETYNDVENLNKKIEFKDYYESLELSRNASPELVELAYNTMSKKYNPVSNNFNLEYSSAKIKEINEAYDVLKNINTRAEYNKIYNEKVISNSINKKKNLKLILWFNGKFNNNKSRFFLCVLLIFAIITSGYFYYNIQCKEAAINIAKDAKVGSDGLISDTGQGIKVDDYVKKGIVGNSSVYKIYGWEAKLVEGNTYYVAYGYDYDNSKSNGYKVISFEVHINNQVVYKITGNQYLIEQYRKKGFIQ